MTITWRAMSHRASSSRGEPVPRRWFREPWPWLLMAGPFVVVVASLASAWIAAATDDGLVAEDYYKQGLLINRRLPATDAPRAPDPAATITFRVDGEVRVHLVAESTPTRLQLSLERPGERESKTVALGLGANGDWVASLGKQTPGRWIVKLESDRWQLPVTTIAGIPSEIRLGATAGGS